jgi:hypothetical protein
METVKLLFEKKVSMNGSPDIFTVKFSLIETDTLSKINCSRFFPLNDSKKINPQEKGSFIKRRHLTFIEGLQHIPGYDMNLVLLKKKTKDGMVFMLKNLKSKEQVLLLTELEVNLLKGSLKSAQARIMKRKQHEK